MIQHEPTIAVGIIEGLTTARGSWRGEFTLNGEPVAEGDFSVSIVDGKMVVHDDAGNPLIGGREIQCVPVNGGRCVIRDVIIGVRFHWEREEDQTFEGSLRFVLRENGSITVINDVPLESYLMSVISSEMSAESPLALLKAHAITSRSWLVAMLDRERKPHEGRS
jgi:hypothetical protein